MGKTKLKTVENTETEALKTSVEAVEKSEAKKEVKSSEGKPQKVRSKKYQQAKEAIEKNKKYPLTEAVKLSQEHSYTKFPATVEAHINTKTKNIRGLVTLPFVSGKKLTILAFGKNAEEAGADIIGTEETIAEIEKGKINFDVLVTTPEWMPKLAKAAKVLGPRSLMPNPKSGTITENLSKTIAELQQGKTEYKTESNGQVIHLAVGKVNQPAEEVAANIKVLYNTIGKSKITQIILSPTMGPGVKVDLGTI